MKFLPRYSKPSMYTITIVMVFLLGVSHVSAAESLVHFHLPAQHFVAGSDVPVDVVVDSVQAINAVDIQISYPHKQLQFVSVDRSGSLVCFWQGGGTLLSPGHLHLTGALLPAFSGHDGRIGVIHFKSLAAGSSVLAVERGDIYLADGNGTKISSGIESSTIVAMNTQVEVPPVTTADEAPLLPTVPVLTLQLIVDPLTRNSIVSYRVSDSGASVGRVEMRSKKWWMWSDWISVENPIPFPKGSVIMEVRAVNNGGVSAVQSVARSRDWKSVLVVSGGILAVILVVLMYTIRRRHNSL